MRTPNATIHERQPLTKVNRARLSTGIPHLRDSHVSNIYIRAGPFHPRPKTALVRARMRKSERFEKRTENNYPNDAPMRTKGTATPGPSVDHSLSEFDPCTVVIDSTLGSY